MDDYDLIVAGGGVAGASAALEAAGGGARVLLLERRRELGGNCPYSGGNLLSITGPEALRHLGILGFGKTPEAVFEAYLRGLANVAPWLASLGADVEPVEWLPACWPHVPGADGVAYYRVSGETDAGPALWNTLERALSESTVVTRPSSPVERLLIEGGRVSGVVSSGEEITSRAGVVLATGGFENDQEMCDAYLPLSPLLSVGAGGGVGDGVRLALSATASLWHMSTFFGFWAFCANEHAVPFPIMPRSASSMIVDSDGRRFHSETAREAHDMMRSVGDYLPSNPNHPHLPAYVIFDDAATADGPLSPFPSANGYRWSDDNRVELEHQWAVSADSPAELAELAELPVSTLRETIAEFNLAAENGEDPLFHRDPRTMRPLVGTVHAMRVWPGVASTSGGPRRDGSARVLDTRGNPIAGLFAAGGNGSVWGQYTHHGGGLTDGIVFGRLAARTALETAARG